MSQTDQFDDDLFMLPNTEDTHTDTSIVGGDYGDIFAFTKEGLAKKIKEDDKFDLQAIPILLVRAVDESILKSPKRTIKAFMEAGITERDIIAINGPLVEALLKDRSIDTGVVLKHIVMSIEDVKYKSISDLLGEQVAFVIMFHHLFFLANTETPLSAIFADDLGVRFDALVSALQPPTGGQNYKNAKTKLDKPQFGIPVDILTKYWKTLETTYVKTESTRISYADLVGTIISGPKSVLKYLVSSQVKLQAGIRNDITEKGFEGLPTEFANENTQKNNDVSNVSSTTETSEGQNGPDGVRVNLSVVGPTPAEPSAPPVSPVEAAVEAPAEAPAVEAPAEVAAEAAAEAPAEASAEAPSEAAAATEVTAEAPAEAEAEAETEAEARETLGKNKYSQNVFKNSIVNAAHTTASGNPTLSRGIVKSRNSHGRYVVYPYLVTRPTELSRTPIRVMPQKVQVTHSVGSISENKEANNNNNTGSVAGNNASDPGHVVPSVRQRKASRRSRNGVGRRTRKLNRRS